MKICFVVGEIFAWGRYGGFGSMTRILGKELAKRGIDVCAVTLQRAGQPSEQQLDGITVLSYPAGTILSSGKLYRKCAADIYHSQEPTLGTYFAQKSMPTRKHIVTSIDPRTNFDWLIEGWHFSLKKKIMFPLIYSFEKNYFVNKAVQRADAVYCQAKYIERKTMFLYGLAGTSGFLPSPVHVPDQELVKAKEPTVCFLARWDRRKRPEMFFKLARQYPHVKFIAVGKAHDQGYDAYLREKYARIPNLEMTGFIDQFSSGRLQEILEQSWIMINTAAREGLPASFLEAAAHKCAILSANNPDGFAENFGYHVRNDNYAAGLEILLKGQRWKRLGDAGYEYVRKTHEINAVIEQHIAIYENLLGKK